MIVKWTTAAELDRMDVMDCIAEDSVRAVLEMDDLFGAAAARPLESLIRLGMRL